MEFLWDDVQVENIYQHVLNTEGEKHPLYSPEKMEECADYILAELASYGLKTEVQEFKVAGYDYTFRNVEGTIGDGSGAELLVVSHYDTVPHAPGANDNGSAIAVMLESARVLEQAELGGNVRFISFNLEEGNPVALKQFRNHAHSLGLLDEQERYRTWHAASSIKKWRMMVFKYAFSGMAYDKAMAKAVAELNDELGDEEEALLKGYEESAKGINQIFSPGKTGLMGSDAWVRAAIAESKDIIGVLCLETMGYTLTAPGSQKLPEQIQADMFEIFETQDDLTVGDFLTIVGDANSASLADVFCEQSRQKSISLPYACLKAPLTYEQAAVAMPDILRSDHAPFWRENIPALLITDTADFRYPFYHTRADTIDKLDFEFLSKICRATIATAAELCR
jgi:hypothetical protein